MKTSSYNPSPIEINFAKAVASLRSEIEKKMPGITIESVKEELNEDNPILRFYMHDDDNDRHELAIRIIQKPDEYL